MSVRILGQPNILGGPVLGASRGGTTYADIVRGLANDLWYRFRETSGTAMENSGTLAGITTTWQPGQNGALGQTTSLGANEGYLFATGTTDSKVTVTNDANLATVAAAGTQRWMLKLFLNSDGESDQGTFWRWANQGDTRNYLRFIAGSTNRLDAVIRTNATIARAISADNALTDCISVPSILFMDYDDSGTRKIRLWKARAVAGVPTLTQISLTTDQAATGTVATQTGDLILGNSADTLSTADGIFDEVTCKVGALWDTDTMTTIMNVCNLA